MKQLELGSASEKIKSYNWFEKSFAFLLNICISYDQGILLLDI